MEKSELQLQLDRIVVGKRSYTVESTVIERSGAAQGPKTARDAAIGAAIVAAIGAIAGGGKGAAIGAGVGAGSGVAVAAITKGEQVLVPSETRLDFRLEQAIDVEVQTKPPSTPATEDRFLSGPKGLGEDSSTWPKAGTADQNTHVFLGLAFHMLSLTLTALAAFGRSAGLGAGTFAGRTDLRTDDPNRFRPPRKTAAAEFDVPRSIPMAVILSLHSLIEQLSCRYERVHRIEW